MLFRSPSPVFYFWKSRGLFVQGTRVALRIGWMRSGLGQARFRASLGQVRFRAGQV